MERQRRGLAAVCEAADAPSGGGHRLQAASSRCDRYTGQSMPGAHMTSALHPASFQLVAPYQPAGDQPQAIEKLIEGFESGLARQTLLGVTGSGKTYTIANVIQQVQKPTLVMAPNKTLAAQLYGEFKSFFPHNAVEYFVSYYD